jgi:Asp-tRNA(Asn)/Glu-tRNA(Gln) amidotransferase B subunit
MSNWVQSEVLRRVNAEGLGELRPAHVVGVQGLVDDGRVNRDGAKALLDALVARGGDPAALLGELGLAQVSDEAALRAVVDELLTQFPGERDRYRQGNKGMLGFFMGRLMTATGRRADTKLANRLLREALDSTS